MDSVDRGRGPGGGSTAGTELGIHELLMRRAARDPDAAAILAPGRKTLSSLGLLRQVEAVASLLHSIGIRAADRVVAVLSNGPEMAVSFLAVAAIAVCAPLNPNYREDELDFYFDDLRPKALIVEAAASPAARAVAARFKVPVIDLISERDQGAGIFTLRTDLPRRYRDFCFAEPHQPALVLHTSGTTSRPKMVPLTQRNLCISAGNIGRTLALTGADRCLNIMPLFHIHGLIGALLSTMTAGGSVVCTPGFNAGSFFGWLEEYRPSWYTAVPTIHQAVLARARHTGTGALKTSLRLIRSSSAALPVPVITELEQMFGVPVIEAYGMTEASHQMASNPLPPAARKPGSVGIASGPRIAILNDEGAVLGPATLGEIVIRGDNVTSGYLNNPDANERAFTDGWFRTGDRGLLDDDGYLFIAGRIKEIINRGGEKIAPRDIEDVLLDHPAIAEAVVFALPDPRLGEDVGAAVVLRPDSSIDQRTLREFVMRRLAGFKCPRRILFVDALPKGTTGKLQRIGMADRLGLSIAEAEAEPATSAHVSPGTPTEISVAKVWQRVLALDSIGINDDFFSLGGDSLAATEAAIELERIHNVPLSVTDLLDGSTIAKLAAIIEDGVKRRHQRRLYTIKEGGRLPPLFLMNAGPLFRTLANLLPSEQPVMSSVLLDFTALPHPCSIEDMAAFHLQTIRAMQPEGPYYLGGWCIDGLVAYELAQQLRAQGEQVALLALFDAANEAELHQSSWPTKQALLLRRRVQKLRLHFGVLRQLRGETAAAYARDRMGTILLMARIRASQAEYRLRVRLGGHLGRLARDVRTIQQWARNRYIPRPYDGDMLLFVRELRPKGPCGDGTGWAGLVAGGIEVHQIPGDHRDMFLEPAVMQTAAVLADSLRKARARADCSSGPFALAALPPDGRVQRRDTAVPQFGGAFGGPG